MRKDGKSQYQIKKEKLLKIKDIIIEAKCEQRKWYGIIITEKTPLNKIWEIVKNEKDNY